MNNKELIVNNENCKYVEIDTIIDLKKTNKINCKRCRGEHCSSTQENRTKLNTNTIGAGLVSALTNATQKGITLIALIITIIILLILAGVTINVLIGENGLFETTQKVGEEYIKAGLKEELETEIINIQSKKIANGEEISRENLWELEKIGATINSVGIPAEGEYKDYNFTVDENYVVTIEGKNNAIKPKIELTKNTEEILEEITIKVKVTIEEGTIKEVTKPDGTKTTETEFEYKVKENKIYTFVAKGSNGGRAVESIEITNVKEIVAKPIIKSNFGYPVLTSSGIVSSGETTITFDNKTGLENYYSIDNGTTWNKYTGSFNVTQESTIKAKSVKNGNILAESSLDVKIYADSLPGVAYDGNEETGWNYSATTTGTGVCYLTVDQSVIGKRIRVLLKRGSLDEWCHGGVLWVFEDGTDEEFAHVGENKTTDLTVTIPENVVKIKCWTQLRAKICEIQLVD